MRASDRTWLLGILPVLVAAGLALWGLDFGLPFLFRPDEDVMVGRAVRMVAEGSLDPVFTNYPPAVFYIFAAAEAVWALAAGGSNLRGAIGADPTSAYLVARMVSALAFAVAVGIVFAAGRRAYGTAAGLVAGLALAVAPLAVRQAHFATTDGVQTAFVAAAMLAGVCAGSRRGFVLAGALCGLAAACKYTGGVAIVFVLVMAWKDSGRAHLGAVVAGAAAAFAVPSAVIVVHLAAYAGGLLFLGGNAVHRGAQLPIGWIYHPTVTLPFGLGPGAYALALAGAAAALWRRRPADLAVLGYAAAYLGLTGAGHEVYFRYELPLLPALALLAGGAVQLPGPRYAVAASALAAILLLPGLYASATSDRLLGAEDTRQLAASWLDSHVHAGSSIASPYYGGPFYDSAEVARNLGYSHDQLAAGFLQGRYSDRYLVNGPDPVVTLLASGPPEQWPPPEPAGHQLARFRPYRGLPPSGGVYDQLDSFYLPIWGFAGLERPGPSITVVGG